MEIPWKLKDAVGYNSASVLLTEDQIMYNV